MLSGYAPAALEDGSWYCPCGGRRLLSFDWGWQTSCERCGMPAHTPATIITLPVGEIVPIEVPAEVFALTIPAAPLAQVA